MAVRLYRLFIMPTAQELYTKAATSRFNANVSLVVVNCDVTPSVLITPTNAQHLYTNKSIKRLNQNSADVTVEV
jgi:hypothetical protein